LLQNITVPLTNSIRALRKDAGAAFDSLNSVNQFRTLGTWALSGLILIVVIVMSVAMMLGKPSAVKG
jgi:hypothetical protein